LAGINTDRQEFILLAPLRVGLGSLHSLGVVVGLRGYGMCQIRGEIRRRTFLKMRRVGHFHSHLSIKSFIFQSPSCPEAVRLSRWEIFVNGVSPVR